MRLAVAAIALLFAVAAHAATTNNDDSCDIALLPAATLLLPYFEVDVNTPANTAKTTLFTVVNTSKEPRIARVTLWTDVSFPVMNFNLFLTGYDAQSINLYDIFALGTVPPTMSGECEAGGPIQSNVLDDVRNALTIGRVTNCGSGLIGSSHRNAIGYATIDVVKSCDSVFPTSERYYNELLYDNVLTGDYAIVNPNPITGNAATGSPLVHIRAIPEGGPAGLITRTSLPYTFYDRYTSRTYGGSATMDRRQPLPSAFVARFIDGGAGGFNTTFQIWREGVTTGTAGCRDYDENLSVREMSFKESVRFDEHENPTVIVHNCCQLAQPYVPLLPPLSSVSASSSLFPPLSTSGDTGGWIYLNLDNGGSSTYSTDRHSQNWVVVTMSADGRYSTAFDATALANGCTPAPRAGAIIGPGPNVHP